MNCLSQREVEERGFMIEPRPMNIRQVMFFEFDYDVVSAIVEVWIWGYLPLEHEIESAVHAIHLWDNVGEKPLTSIDLDVLRSEMNSKALEVLDEFYHRVMPKNGGKG